MDSVIRAIDTETGEPAEMPAEGGSVQEEAACRTAERFGTGKGSAQGKPSCRTAERSGTEKGSAQEEAAASEGRICAGETAGTETCAAADPAADNAGQRPESEAASSVSADIAGDDTKSLPESVALSTESADMADNDNGNRPEWEHLPAESDDLSAGEIAGTESARTDDAANAMNAVDAANADDAGHGPKAQIPRPAQTHKVRRILPGVAAAGAVALIAAGWFTYVNSGTFRYDTAVEKGTEYAAQQQYDLAAASFEKALSIGQSGEDLETQILLMESFAGAGEYEAIEEQLSEALVTASQEEYELLKEAAVKLMAEGAGTAQASGDADLAVELYEKVLEWSEEGSTSSDNADAQLADLYLEQAVRTSLSLYRAVLEKDPDNAEALVWTAGLYESLGSYDEAIGYYEQLTETGGDVAAEATEGIARCWRSIAAQRTGSSAIEAWETSLLWDAGNEEAYLTLAQLYVEEGDTQSAAAVLEEGLSVLDSQELQAMYDEIYVSEFEQLVAQIIESITTEEMTAEEQRLACYQYIIDTTTYVRTYEQPSGDWTKEYALDVLTLQQGNCFRYAAAFAYMCAELGYEAKVCTGEVSAASGGTTPHGWVVLTIDGTEYLCDPDLEQSLGYDFYMKTYEAYPVKPLITEAEWEIEF